MMIPSTTFLTTSAPPNFATVSAGNVSTASNKSALEMAAQSLPSSCGPSPAPVTAAALTSLTVASSSLFDGTFVPIGKAANDDQDDHHPIAMSR